MRGFLRRGEGMASSAASSQSTPNAQGSIDDDNVLVHTGFTQRAIGYSCERLLPPRWIVLMLGHHINSADRPPQGEGRSLECIHSSSEDNT
jgi:hypothetical protein